MKIHRISFTGQASGNNSMCGLWEAKHGHFEATYDTPKVTCKRCLAAIGRKENVINEHSHSNPLS